MRGPDATVHCGLYDRDRLYVDNLVIVAEVVSLSSVRSDVDRRLIDYFSVPTILHYLIVYGDEKRVVRPSGGRAKSLR
ncbi:PDDEXK family nuclease [Aurantimonas marina]|uniref:hypothetical protein n=1 Tax=Aurantimonas marina TaxID=2780508 RepID=UPI0019D1F70B|nr:hypothetical protein [Aurantimonas marina]